MLERSLLGASVIVPAKFSLLGLSTKIPDMDLYLGASRPTQLPVEYN